MERTGSPVSNLNKILHSEISNQDTRNIVENVCDRLGDEKPDPCPPEDGLSYGINSDEGKALLGTPNGLGAGWLLAQHRSEFPGKMITSVRISGVDDEFEPSINMEFDIM